MVPNNGRELWNKPRAYGKAEYNRLKKASYELGAGGPRAAEGLVGPGTQAVQRLLKASQGTTAPATRPRQRLEEDTV